MAHLTQSQINIFGEEDYIKEFVMVYNHNNPDNPMATYDKRDPDEPDFLVKFADGTKVYIEVTQIPSFSGESAPHNHRLFTFCAELREQIDSQLPQTYAKLVVELSAKFNELPAPKSKHWLQLLSGCEELIVKNSTATSPVVLMNKSVPSDLSSFDSIVIRYLPKSLRSVVIVPNTFEAYWEEQRVSELHKSVSVKNGKKYDLKKIGRVWLLIHDGEGFGTIISNLQRKGGTVSSEKFERIFLQEEYDPRSGSYPYTELALS